MHDVKAGVYQHYKGKFYLVLGVARHTETEELLVVYIPLYIREGARISVRPYEMFFENVQVNGIEQPRFSYIGAEVTKEFVAKNT